MASDEYGFTAARDGRYRYCFGNEAWSSNTKEVSFNVHGVVYVPASEIQKDPIELEGPYSLLLARTSSHHGTLN